MQDGAKRKIDNGQMCSSFMSSKYIHRSLLVPNHHVNNAKGHLLERKGVLYRELKNIRSIVVIAITVTAPGTVDDGDMTELYAHESHF